MYVCTPYIGGVGMDVKYRVKCHGGGHIGFCPKPDRGLTDHSHSPLLVPRTSPTRT